MHWYFYALASDQSSCPATMHQATLLPLQVHVAGVGSRASGVWDWGKASMLQPCGLMFCAEEQAASALWISAPVLGGWRAVNSWH